MSRQVLIDTGPLVALLNPDDESHALCAKEAQSLPKKRFSSWLVLTEAVYLLRRRHDHVRNPLRFVEEGLIDCLPLDEDAAQWFQAFFHRYGDREPQLADASLVYLAEREGADTVFTLDRRDFSVYRLSDNRALNIVPPRNRALRRP